MLRFTWGEAKAAINFVKHRLAMEHGARLWSDPYRLEQESKRPHSDEDRRLTIGAVDGVILVAVYVIRDDVIRLISVRQAKRRERRRYQDAKEESKDE